MNHPRRFILFLTMNQPDHLTRYIDEFDIMEYKKERQSVFFLNRAKNLFSENKTTKSIDNYIYFHKKNFTKTNRVNISYYIFLYLPNFEKDILKMKKLS